MNRRTLGSTFALALLALACFAGLASDPTALIVDAEHPSLDHARTVDDPSIGNDLTRLFLPHHLAISRSIARLGRLPTWDDRGFGGRPLVGNPQAGLFYPPTWLTWWSGVPSSLGWITLGHLLFAAWGVDRLARTLDFGGWGRLVAAGCFQASPYMLAQVFEGHYPHVWAACWYPWAFESAVRLRRGDHRAAFSLAPILAATFLAGHPQEGYYLGIALGCWAAWDGWLAIRSGRAADAARRGGLWGLALALAVGLVGVELVPDAMAQPWGLKGSKLSLRLAERYHLHPINALQLLQPRAIGGPADYFGHENYWESVTSIGLIPLVLAIVAVGWSGDRRQRRGWLILVVGSLVFASGRKLGLFAVLYQILPGMERFRVPARSLFLASLGASMLAGMGVDALRARAGDDRKWLALARRLAIATLALLLVVMVVGRGSSRLVLDSKGTTDRGRLIRGLAGLSSDPVFLGPLGATTLLVAIGARIPGSRKGVAAVLGLLGLVELGWHGHVLMTTTPASRFLDTDPISRALEQARADGPSPPTRIRVVDSLYDDLRAGFAGFEKTNVNDSFQIQHAADLYRNLYHLFDDRTAARGWPMDRAVAERSLRTRRAILDRMGVSLLVDDHVAPEAPWPLAASGTWDRSTFAVYRNPSALPRAYVVPRAEFAGEDASILEHFRESDPRSVVFLPFDPLGPDARCRQPFTPAEWTSSDPDRIVLRVSTEAPGLLVVADTWMPGWIAKVDDRPETILRGNHAQRVIPLRTLGRHEVVLTYHAPGLRAGLALTLASASIWSVWMGLLAVRARSNRL